MAVAYGLWRWHAGWRGAFLLRGRTISILESEGMSTPLLQVGLPLEWKEDRNSAQCWGDSADSGVFWLHEVLCSGCVAGGTPGTGDNAGEGTETFRVTFGELVTGHLGCNSGTDGCELVSSFQLHFHRLWGWVAVLPRKWDGRDQPFPAANITGVVKKKFLNFLRKILLRAYGSWLAFWANDWVSFYKLRIVQTIIVWAHLIDVHGDILAFFFQ